MSEPSPSLALARRISAVGLPGAASPEAPLRVSFEGWPGVLDLLTRQRLTGIAVSAVKEGQVEVHEEGRQELFDAHRRAMALVLGLERKLLEVTGAFEGAGVGSVALKGAAFAHTFYPAPTWRTYGDIDVLVRSRDWRTACTVLSSLGFHRLLPEPRPGFDERFGKGAAHEDDEGFQVDLHRTLTLGPFGMWLDPDRLFEGTVDMTLGARTLQRLDDQLSLLHACIHASLGRRDPLIMPLRDVMQVAWSGAVDWETFQGYARRWRLTGPVAHALRTASDILEAELPDAALPSASANVGYLERRVLAGYTTDRRDAGGTTITTVAAIHGIRAKAAYLRALAFPSHEFLAARTGGGGSYRRRWTVPIGWIRRQLAHKGNDRRG